MEGLISSQIRGGREKRPISGFRVFGRDVLHQFEESPMGNAHSGHVEKGEKMVARRGVGVLREGKSQGGATKRNH